MGAGIILYNFKGVAFRECLLISYYKTIVFFEWEKHFVTGPKL